VGVSSTGKNFVDKVVEYRPDFITIEVLLPDTHGFSILSTLQEDERTSDIPVIFVTVTEAERGKGLKMGARS